MALTLEGTTIGVAEHTVLLMLAAAKRLTFADAELRSGRWHVNALRGVSRELFGKQIGYVGMGRIGQAVAERLKAFGCSGIYADPVSQLSLAQEAALGLRRASLDEVLAAADFLTIHVPLTASTRGLIGRAAIARLKPGTIVVNTARGGIIDESALAEALASSHVLAAGLDVFERAPNCREPTDGDVQCHPDAAHLGWDTRCHAPEDDRHLCQSSPFFQRRTARKSRHFSLERT